MTRRRSFAVAICALALNACRTANGPAAAKDLAPPPAAVEPVLSIEGAIGSPAAALYEQAGLDEASDLGVLKKTYVGKLAVQCAPTACSFTGAAAFLRVDGDTARAVWAAFKGGAGASAERTYAADAGEFVCARRAGTYRCTVGAPGASGSAPASRAEVLSIMGGRASVAGTIWNTLTAVPTVQGGVATKSVGGRIAFRCSLAGTPFCAASRPAAPGASGTPPAPFLKLDGVTAKGLFEALQVAAADGAKAFRTDAGELWCGKGGNEQYSCTLRGQAGGT